VKHAKQERICLKRFYQLPILISATLLFQGAIASGQQARTPETHVYKTVNGLDIKADVYRPAGGHVTPAIVWIHGGALIMGSRDTIRSFELERYLSLGYTVVAIDYRLAPETKLPAILEDVQDAYAWAQKRAGELHIDPSRIGVVGHSAGGYLALATGYLVNPRPKVIVSFYGYGDVDGPWYSQPDPYYLKNESPVSEAQAEASVGTVEVTESPKGSQRGPFYTYLRQQGLWTERVTGLNAKRDEAILRKFSPVKNVTPDYPPTMLLHGDADTDVPFQEAVDMNNALTRETVPHDFIELHGKGHGFDRNLNDPEVAAAFNAEVEFLNAWLHPSQTKTDNANDGKR
jgi:acetyl esterase/lipase